MRNRPGVAQTDVGPRSRRRCRSCALARDHAGQERTACRASALGLMSRMRSHTSRRRRRGVARHRDPGIVDEDIDRAMARDHIRDQRRPAAESRTSSMTPVALPPLERIDAAASRALPVDADDGGATGGKAFRGGKPMPLPAPSRWKSGRQLLGHGFSSGLVIGGNAARRGRCAFDEDERSNRDHVRPRAGGRCRLHHSWPGLPSAQADST